MHYMPMICYENNNREKKIESVWALEKHLQQDFEVCCFGGSPNVRDMWKGDTLGKNAQQYHDMCFQVEQEYHGLIR